MRPIIKGLTPTDTDGNEIKFVKYSRSRRYLIDRIGEYCSYCERKIESNLAVEHVQPKDSNPQLRLDWNNFLLGCTNCNSTKGNTNVILSDYVWPDTDNTYRYFSYDHTGIVNISNTINDQNIESKIKNMLDLVGLQNSPPRHGSADWERASDRRYEHRILAWSDANHYMNAYNNSSDEIRTIMIPLIITIVIHQGFWSIWMNVFENFPEMQIELISSIPGTNTAYFPELFPIS